jgi:hypothetical protein
MQTEMPTQPIEDMKVKTRQDKNTSTKGKHNITQHNVIKYDCSSCTLMIKKIRQDKTDQDKASPDETATRQYNKDNTRQSQSQDIRNCPLLSLRFPKEYYKFS